MKATDLLILPADIVLRPADTVEHELQERLHHQSGDFVLTRPGSRTRSLLVDAAAATLLQMFREPCTLADALIEVSRNTGTDPERLLDEVLPLVGFLRQHRLLVVAESEDAREIKPTLAPSSTFEGVRVLECVHLFEDVEVYHVVDGSGLERALKILRPTADPPVARALGQEVAILERLDGMHVPRVLTSGEADGRRFVMTSWCGDPDVSSVAKDLRDRSSPASVPHEVAPLCVRVLRAYAHLHDARVLHGDVHPGNIKVGRDGSVTLLDFALGSCAAPEAALPPLGRGGIAEYIEPEFCAALVRGEPGLTVTTLSEQYALGALCFLLLTGAPYLQFHLQHEAWRSQVVGDPPRSFFACGAQPWPAVERVLTTALAKDPAARFPRVCDFADQLDQASRTTPRRSRTSKQRDEFVDRVVRRCSPDPDGIPSGILPAPVGTVNGGAAGIAYFYYRLAGISDDPTYVATADLWSSWARGPTEDRGSAHTDALGRAVGAARSASLFHGQPGIECVDALIQYAAGDHFAADAACERFLDAGGAWWNGPDVVFGRAGLLLGCAALIEALSPTRLADSAPGVQEAIAALGDRLALAAPRSVPTAERSTTGRMGFAHGRTGIAFAGLRWCEATGRAPTWLPDELDALAGVARRAAPTTAASSGCGSGGAHRAQRTSWCSGAAGQTLLWNLADRCYPESFFAPLADAAATAIWRERDSGSVNASLCCGFAGQAYALLATFRRTGSSRWLARAEALGERAVIAAARSGAPGSLYKGDLGVALLAADLRQPEGSCMPLLETEGWRSG